MEYQLVKSINNNVVLVYDEEHKEQLILMAKGIGFHRKAGERISDNSIDGPLYKFWNNTQPIYNVDVDKKQIEAAVKKVMQYVRQKLSIQNDNLYSALLDHILFAVERMHFALPIENPFINEISILYSEEYETAKTAVDILNESLGVDMGNAEIGYIALHLRAARKNAPVQLSIDNVRMYNEVVQILSSFLNENLIEMHSEIRSFLISLNNIVRMNRNGKPIQMPCKKAVQKSMAESFQIAKKIGALIETETQCKLNEDILSYITIDIEKLKQIIGKGD